MKIIALLSWLIIALVPQSKTISSANPDSIIGTYWSPKKDGKMEIFKSGTKYYGKLIWGNNPAKDIHNPDPALRSKDVIGMVFMRDFVYDDGEYVDGKIYDPTSGKTYSCSMWPDGKNLKVRGYIGFSMLGRTEIFERIN